MNPRINLSGVTAGGVVCTVWNAIFIEKKKKVKCSFRFKDGAEFNGEFDKVKQKMSAISID